MKKKIIFAASLILLVVLMSNAESLGVVPAKSSVNFVPQGEETIVFSIINSENQNLVLTINAEGELAQFIEVLDKEVAFSLDEEKKEVGYLVKFPESLSPGPHKARIFVTQLSEEGTGETSIGASLAVANELEVNVPFPGKYVDAGLDFSEENGEVNFVIPVVSRGELDIDKARAEIEVFNSFDETVAVLSSEAKAIPSKERRDFSVSWRADVSPGRYKVIAKVFYDGAEPRSIEREFNIGGDVLVLRDLSVRDFSLGEIAKFDAVVENLGREKVEGASVKIIVFDENEKVLSEFESPTLDVEGFEEAELALFWDTSNIKEGEYSSKLVLNSGEKIREENFVMDISQNGIEIIGLSYVISGPSLSPGFNSPSNFTVLVVIVIVLVFINLAWFFFFRKKLKKRR